VEIIITPCDRVNYNGVSSSRTAPRGPWSRDVVDLTCPVVVGKVGWRNCLAGLGAKNHPPKLQARGSGVPSEWHACWAWDFLLVRTSKSADAVVVWLSPVQGQSEEVSMRRAILFVCPLCCFLPSLLRGSLKPTISSLDTPPA